MQWFLIYYNNQCLLMSTLMFLWVNITSVKWVMLFWYVQRIMRIMPMDWSNWLWMRLCVFQSIEYHQRWFRLDSYNMATVLATASCSRGVFSLCLTVSTSLGMVPGGSSFHLEPGTIHPCWNLTGTGCLWWSLDLPQIAFFSIRDRGGDYV